MNDRFDELLDESVLRRSLRLESDERPPRLDPAAFAAAATRQRLSARGAAMGALVLGVTGALAVWSWLNVIPAAASTAFDTALTLAAFAAVPAQAVIEVVQQPAVPLSLVTALAIAIVYELRQRPAAVAIR